ncbi:hypothetical protein D3C71_412200 [compost metagenome]
MLQCNICCTACDIAIDIPCAQHSGVSEILYRCRAGIACNIYMYGITHCGAYRSRRIIAFCNPYGVYPGGSIAFFHNVTGTRGNGKGSRTVSGFGSCSCEAQVIASEKNIITVNSRTVAMCGGPGEAGTNVQVMVTVCRSNASEGWCNTYSIQDQIVRVTVDYIGENFTASAVNSCGLPAPGNSLCERAKIARIVEDHRTTAVDDCRGCDEHVLAGDHPLLPGRNGDVRARSNIQILAVLCDTTGIVYARTRHGALRLCLSHKEQPQACGRS